MSSTRRSALVTGADGGIGRAIVARLRADGHEVITLDIAGDVDIRADLRSDSFPEEAVRRVDICVSNAALTSTIAPAHRMSQEQWDGDIAVNLTGAFRIIQACLPGMRERRWGRVIAVSSAAARVGLSGQIAYSS